MAKWLFTLSILLIYSTATYAAQGQGAEVYRWVDEDGNVHFSDLPRDKEAKLFFIKPGNSSAADKGAISYQQELQANAQASESNERENTTNTNDEELFLGPNTAEKCRDLRVEMNKISRDLNSGTPEKQQLARIFLEKADKALIDSNCK